MKILKWLIGLLYLAVLLWYVMDTAVQLGLVIPQATFADMWQALLAGDFQLSEYFIVRKNNYLSELWLVNMLRGGLLIILMYTASHLIPFSIAMAARRSGKKWKKPKRKSKADKKASAAHEERAVYEDNAVYEAHEDNTVYGAYEDKVMYEDTAVYSKLAAYPHADAQQGGVAVMPYTREEASMNRQSFADPQTEEENRPAAEAEEIPDKKQEAEKTAKKQIKKNKTELAEDYFSDLGAVLDNVRIIIRVTQYDEEGNPVLSFYKGDTMTLKKSSTYRRWWYTTENNRPVPDMDKEVNDFIKKTQKQRDVYYELKLKEDTIQPVMLIGDRKKACELFRNAFTLRLYKEAMLFIAHNAGIRRSKDTAGRLFRSVLVQRQDGTASRTYQYADTLYYDDLEFEIEVRIKK